VRGELRPVLPLLPNDSSILDAACKCQTARKPTTGYRIQPST